MQTNAADSGPLFVQIIVQSIFPVSEGQPLLYQRAPHIRTVYKTLGDRASISVRCHRNAARLRVLVALGHGSGHPSAARPDLPLARCAGLIVFGRVDAAAQIDALVKEIEKWEERVGIPPGEKD